MGMEMGSLIAFAALVLLLVAGGYLMFFGSPARRDDGVAGPSETDYSIYDNGGGGSNGHHSGD
jgi:hypothetical protein